MLGFPCNQFARAGARIGRRDRGVLQGQLRRQLPDVREGRRQRPEAHPYTSGSRSETRGLLGSRVKWNFTKWLVDRNGTVLGRYSPNAEPADIADDVSAVLSAAAA